ncbi:MAG: endonuclease/exonuclease/phosphatase family protein [Bacteroidia bacterium]
MAILLLLASYLAPFITPEISWHIAFLGLAYPAILAVNMLFILYWIIFLNLKFMFSLAAIIIGINYVPRFIQIGSKKAPQSDTACVQILTFNAKYFNVPDPVDKTTEDFFFEKIDKINPDLLAFQEMSSDNTLKNNVYSRLQKKYNHFHKGNIRVVKGTWVNNNIAILSRFPLIESGIVEHDPTSGNYTIYADFTIDRDTLRLITTHLQSIGIQEEEYQAVEKLKEEFDSLEISQYRRIAGKIKRAFMLRALQADQIRDFIAKSPHKVILTGDFNDSPTSYAYRTIRGEMKDAFMEAGVGLGRTYVGPMPSLRIDYIMGDPSFEFYNYYAKSFSFSDHKMVSCTVKLR